MSRGTMAARAQRNTRGALPAAERLIVEGGDARIALDPESAANKYGCTAVPDPGLLAFGSSTASVISEASFAAVEQLRRRLLQFAAAEPRAVTYARELHRIRRELLQLCGIADVADLDVVFAASGTDAHLIASQLAGGTESLPALAIMVDGVETGTCVPSALAGRHFSSQTALGSAVDEGTPLAGGRAVEVANVAIRLADGSPRPPELIDADVESLVKMAAAMGRRVLLTLADVTKTGMIAPSHACVLALRRELPDTVEVLVDACQFRIAPSTLRSYLNHGFMVALTGSKFVTGPTFSGALLFPPAAARRFRGRMLPQALRAYSARAEWPSAWVSAGSLENTANFGLLLRWEAALEELRAFRAVPEAEVASFLRSFADAIGNRLIDDGVFEMLPVPPLDRRALLAPASWDHIQTIFPFVLNQSKSRAAKRTLSREETMRVYRLLQVDLAHHADFERGGTSGHIASSRCQLGQPVACGVRDGVPVSALRLCASTRLIVEAAARGGRNAAAVIEKAMTALDKIALLV